MGRINGGGGGYIPPYNPNGPGGSGGSGGITGSVREPNRIISVSPQDANQISSYLDGIEKESVLPNNPYQDSKSEIKVLQDKISTIQSYHRNLFEILQRIGLFR